MLACWSKHIWEIIGKSCAQGKYSLECVEINKSNYAWQNI